MNHVHSSILLGLIAVTCVACSTIKWTETTQQSDGARYVQQLVKSLPFEVDSVCSISKDNYFVFENQQAICVAPDYEIQLDSVVYGMNGEVFRPESRQRVDVIWRNVYAQPSHHRLICVDRITIGKRHVGVVYVIQSSYKGMRDFPDTLWDPTSWECTDFRNTMLLDGFYKGWMENTFDLLLRKKGY